MASDRRAALGYAPSRHRLLLRDYLDAVIASGGHRIAAAALTLADNGLGNPQRCRGGQKSGRLAVNRPWGLKR
jgi:hypothetical protein